MKNKFLYILSASVILFGACKKGYLDINDNPNASTSASSALVLTGALNTTAAATTGNSIFYTFAGQWMNYWATTGGVSGWFEERTYNFTSSWGGSTVLWANAYDNLEDYYYLENKARSEGKDFYVAIAKTMKAWDYGYLVDFYGNIPYSQALQSTAFITPKYDKAQDVYDDLVKQLDSAATLFKNVTVPNPDKNYDIFTKGDPLAWGRFANTLKLRMLMRQSEIPGRDTYIRAEIAKITANGMGYIGTGQSIKNNPGYLNSTGKQNPFYANFGYTIAAEKTAANGRNYYLASDYGMNFLADNDDPRLGKLYTTINDGAGTTYASLPFGGEPGNTDTKTNISAIGFGLIKAPTQDQYIMTDFESLFIQAEMAQRGYISGDAKAFYQSAVAANFLYLGLSQAEADAYLADQAVANWDTNTDKIALIIKQKWAAMNGSNDIEPWSDYRRLELPADMPISRASGVTTRKIPVRMLYPQNEYSYNATNVAAEGNISQFTSRLFWDVK
jgi:hypothetical protein